MNNQQNNRLIKAIAAGNVKGIQHNLNPTHPTQLITGVNIVEMVNGEPTITKTIKIGQPKDDLNQGK